MKIQIVATLLFVATHGVSIVALGQTSNAEKLFEQAVDEAKRGDFVKACPHFEESFKQDGNTGTLLSLANCLNDARKITSAFARYEEFINAFANLNGATRARNKGAVQSAVNALNDLKPRIPRLKLILPNGAPKGLVVSLDGISLSDSELRAEQWVDPGTHTLAVDVPGRKREAWEIVMQEGQSREEPIRIPEPPASPSPVSVPVKPKAVAVPDAAQSRWTRREVAMVSGGSVAMAGLIAGGVPFGLAMSKMSDVKAHCPNKVCDTQEWAQQARETQTLANISTIGAVLGGLGGAVFFGALFAGGKTNTPKPRIEAGVWHIDSTGATFGLKGAF